MKLFDDSRVLILHVRWCDFFYFEDNLSPLKQSDDSVPKLLHNPPPGKNIITKLFELSNDQLEISG